MFLESSRGGWLALAPMNLSAVLKLAHVYGWAPNPAVDSYLAPGVTFDAAATHALTAALGRALPAVLGARAPLPSVEEVGDRVLDPPPAAIRWDRAWDATQQRPLAAFVAVEAKAYPVAVLELARRGPFRLAASAAGAELRATVRFHAGLGLSIGGRVVEGEASLAISWAAQAVARRLGEIVPAPAKVAA